MKLKSTIEYQTDLVCLKRTEFNALMKERSELSESLTRVTAELEVLKSKA